ncbi:MAG TPA: hypothetical protein VGF47_11030 [Solirubrobacteraceae bacterium]|jgi:hypothetical protein
MGKVRHARIYSNCVLHRIGVTLAIGGLVTCSIALAGLSSAAALSGPHRQPEIVARGITTAGTSYTVTAKKGDERSCRARIVIAEIAPDGRFESGSCFTGFLAEEISMTCPGDRVAIEATVPAVTRKIRVRLADGHMLSSRVAEIPPRDGGPLGVYFQAVPASGAWPVSLIELDAEGRRLGRAHNLQSHSSCTRGSHSATGEERSSGSAHS